jgi:cytochrome c5
MKTLLAAFVLAMLASPALAQDEKVVLKDGPGKDAVENACAACHSLDYIPMNSPFLDHAKWDATVKKMISAFGASIEPAEVQAIVDYLAKNYGG